MWRLVWLVTVEVDPVRSAPKDCRHLKSPPSHPRYRSRLSCAANSLLNGSTNQAHPRHSLPRTTADSNRQGLKNPCPAQLLSKPVIQIALVHGSENHLFEPLHQSCRATYPKPSTIEPLGLDCGLAHIQIPRSSWLVWISLHAPAAGPRRELGWRQGEGGRDNPVKMNAQIGR